MVRQETVDQAEGKHARLLEPLIRVVSQNGVKFKDKPLWPLIAGLLWILLVFIGYYIVHKPVSISQILALIEVLVHLGSALLLAGLAGGLGRRLVRASQLAPLERFGLQAALGWGVLGLGWLAAGVAGAYHPMIAWAVLLVGWILLWQDNLSWFGELRSLGRLWRESGFLERTLAGVVSVFVGLQLVYTLAPPVQWDALMYHLELPRRYLSLGRFEFIPSNPYWGQPQLGEMAYTWGMALAGSEAAAVLGWIFQAILLVSLLGSFAKRVGLAAGWVAILALLSGFSFRWMMSGAYVDGLASLMGFAALLCLFIWVDEQRDKWLFWAAVLTGFALWSKLTALILLPLLAVSILATKTHRSRQVWGRVLLVLLVPLVVFSPWLLVNTVYTGNPLFPHIWPTEWASLERLAFFERPGESAGIQALWLPLAATWYGLETARIDGIVAYGSDMGPLLVLLAIPGLIAKRKSPMGKILAIWLLGGWLGMVIGGSFSPLLWQTRLYWVLLPAACMAAGLGWHALTRIKAYEIRLGRILAAGVLIVSSLTIWQDVQSAVIHNPLSAVLGAESPEQYLESRLGWYAAAMRGVRGLPGDSRTLFLWEPRGYYAPRTAEADVWIDRWYLARREYGSPAAILQAWQEQGFTHLLVYQRGAEFEQLDRLELTLSDWQALDDLIAGLNLHQDFGGIYQLYSLTP